MNNSSNTETLTKHYEVLIDAYKHHLDLVLKVDAFYYAVTGAITSYYLSKPNVGYMRFALILPILMGATLAIFVFFAAYWVDPAVALGKPSRLRAACQPQLKFPA